MDNTAPTVTITGVPDMSSAAFTATITFTEPVTGFVLTDITLTNATASNFTGADGETAFTALITPSANGAVTVDVTADVAMDAAGNGNTAAVRASSTYDPNAARSAGARRRCKPRSLAKSPPSPPAPMSPAPISPPSPAGCRCGDSSISALAAGDFAGLTVADDAVSEQQLAGATLPAGVFDEMTALTVTASGDNDLSSLPAGVFDEMTAR